eukprot:COSAG06_NODE_210_length_20171_cov_14.683489_9_plen_274_part_00
MYIIISFPPLSMLKMIIVPRQARDKHSESTQKRDAHSHRQREADKLAAVEAEAKRKKVEKNRKKKAKKKKKLAEKEAAGAEAADSARVATIVAEAPEPEPQPEPELEPQPEPEPEPEPDEPTAAPERVFSFDSLGADQQRSRPSQAVFQFRAGKTVERESAAAVAAAGAQPEPQPQPQQVSEPKPKPDDGTAELRAKFDAGVEQWSAAQVVQWVALQAELLPAGSTQLVTAAFESLGAEGTHSSCFFVPTILHTTQSFTQTGSLQRMFHIRKH